jgi:benzodiazapine receptor
MMRYYFPDIYIMNQKNLALLFTCIVICEFAGFIGSIATFPAIPAWYSGLTKPWFSPPNWVFGPVWTLLYALMGSSLYLVIKNGMNPKNLRGFYFFGVQLSLNILWSIIFFALKSPFFAFIEILFLMASIILTMAEFRKVDKNAFYLLLPYLAWVIFASALNFWVWELNP